MSDEVSRRMGEYLRNNPRMIGVPFMVAILLSQAGNALAACGCGGCTRGP